MNIILNALGRFLSWILGTGVLKSIFTAIVVVSVATLSSILLGFIPDWLSSDGITSRMGSLGSEIWFLIYYFQIDGGISLLFSAYAARFLIRRMPVIG